jgi:LysR family transcriptional regulator for metE and metH
VLEIRHLKTLHALREADSLVEAAERLHLTQSALSHQFKELEERLGLPLFVRKTKPMRFTSAGLRLLQLADATLPLLAAPSAISRGWPAAPPGACTWRSRATAASSG